jgi:predicted DCC family thiol-disulfide oxidoreductase YuxK
MYTVIYDGNCNLCTTLVKALESWDRGDRFQYISMQEPDRLQHYGITTEDCQKGMLLINADSPDQRWQGTEAAEEIGRLLPMGERFIALYRALPGLKGLGDKAYEQIRDNRYDWFGKRSETYQSSYPFCQANTCQPDSKTSH